MPRVAIIGAGLAGLACARRLQRAGVEWTILEASDGVGGRARTDLVDGYRLDRGFQVLLTGYQEAGEVLDLPALQLRSFYAGALVFDGAKLVRLANPLRHPMAAARSIATQTVTALDAARLAPIAFSAARTRVAEPGAPDGATLALLRRMDLSRGIVDGFFRSFFGGVFLDRSLETDASIFRFLFACFARGDVAVPAQGMGAIAAQLAGGLGEAGILLRRPAVQVHRRGGSFEVRTADGAAHAADAVVYATDMTAAHALDARIPARHWQATTTLHYACDRINLPSTLHEPVLHLDGTGEGPVNHAACISSVAPEYAPPGKALVSLNLVDTDWANESMAAIQARTVRQMERWFGPGAMRRWQLLRIERIPRALPRQHEGDLHTRPAAILDDGLFLAGDHVTEGSIDGALRSGRHAAEAACAWLRHG
ncbi:MAG: NAD(P)/FAD-dependent oxidoreductase [Phycisphaerales bacterium]